MSRVLNPIIIANGTFNSWIATTNTVVDAFTETVTVKANTAGDMTTGNGFITGTFGANTITATFLRGGNVQSNSVLTITTNTNIGNSSVDVSYLHNNVAHVKAGSHTTTNTDAQIVDTFDSTLYRAGKYLISIKDTANTEYQSTEIMVLQNGTNASTTEYAVLSTATTLATFSANIDSGSVRLYCVPSFSNNVIKFQRTLLTV